MAVRFSWNIWRTLQTVSQLLQDPHHRPQYLLQTQRLSSVIGRPETVADSSNGHKKAAFPLSLTIVQKVQHWARMSAVNHAASVISSPLSQHQVHHPTAPHMHARRAAKYSRISSFHARLFPVRLSGLGGDRKCGHRRSSGPGSSQWESARRAMVTGEQGLPENAAAQGHKCTPVRKCLLLGPAQVIRHFLIRQREGDISRPTARQPRCLGCLNVHDGHRSCCCRLHDRAKGQGQQRFYCRLRVLLCDLQGLLIAGPIRKPFCHLHRIPTALVRQQVPNPPTTCTGKQPQLPVAGFPSQEFQHRLRVSTYNHSVSVMASFLA